MGAPCDGTRKVVAWWAEARGGRKGTYDRAHWLPWRRAWVRCAPPSLRWDSCRTTLTMAHDPAEWRRRLHNRVHGLSGGDLAMLAPPGDDGQEEFSRIMAVRTGAHPPLQTGPVPPERADGLAAPAVPFSPYGRVSRTSRQPALAPYASTLPPDTPNPASPAGHPPYHPATGSALRFGPHIKAKRNGAPASVRDPAKTREMRREALHPPERKDSDDLSIYHLPSQSNDASDGNGNAQIREKARRNERSEPTDPRRASVFPQGKGGV